MQNNWKFSFFAAPEEENRLRELKHQFSAMNTSTIAPIIESTTTMSREQIRNEIETILASDCLYCGEHMINSIDKPFIDDWDKVNMAWE